MEFLGSQCDYIAALALQAEFEVICEEAQLLSKFALLNELAAQQGLFETTDAGYASWHCSYTSCSWQDYLVWDWHIDRTDTGALDDVSVEGKPSDMVHAQTVAAKLKEIDELSAILEQASRSVSQLAQALHVT